MRMRKDRLEQAEREVKQYAEFLIESKMTIRQVAREFDVSPSRVQRYLKVLLPEVDEELNRKVIEILEANNSDRHLKGGEATKKKYLMM